MLTMHMTWIRRHQQHPSPVMWSLSVQISVFVKDVRSRKKSNIVEYMAFSAYIQGIQRFDVLLRILRDDLIFFAVQMCHRSKLQDWWTLDSQYRISKTAWLKWESDLPTASHIKTTTRMIKVRLIRTVWDHPGRLWLIMFVWLDLLQGGFLAH